MTRPASLGPELFGMWHGSTDPDARVFVGLHGWNGSHRSFEPVLDLLPSDVALLSFDQPGFGASAAPEAWTLEAFSAPILRALEQIEGVGSRMTFVGHCAGAALSLELAIRMPGRVAALVLIDPFAFVPWYFALLTRGPFARLFYTAAFANPLGRLVTNVALASRRGEGTNLTEHFSKTPHERSFRYLKIMCRPRPLERYAGLAMPVTLLYGARTFEAVRRSVRMFEDLWPQARSYELEGAGHLPLQEATNPLVNWAFAPPRVSS